jgi:hypothetical protein
MGINGKNGPDSNPTPVPDSKLTLPNTNTTTTPTTMSRRGASSSRNSIPTHMPVLHSGPPTSRNSGFFSAVKGAAAEAKEDESRRSNPPMPFSKTERELPPEIRDNPEIVQRGIRKVIFRVMKFDDLPAEATCPGQTCKEENIKPKVFRFVRTVECVVDVAGIGISYEDLAPEIKAILDVLKKECNYCHGHGKVAVDTKFL